MIQIALDLQLISSIFMTGLIWLIQLVHYPSFSYISPSRFQEFHRYHCQRITWVVAPMMGVELLSAIALCLSQSTAAYMNLGLVVLLWLATAFVSVPIHNQLGVSFDQNQVYKLVRTNWIRTILWSIRAIGWCWIFITGSTEAVFIQGSFSKSMEATQGITRKVIQKYKIPNTDESLTLTEVTMPPQSEAPVHLHPVPGLVYITEGLVETQYEGEGPRRFHQGESTIDHPNRKHLVFRNLSKDQSLRFLVFFKIKNGVEFKQDLP